MKKKRRNFCQDTLRYKTAKVAGEFIGLLNRLFKSILFNIFAFIAGFGCCFIILEVNFHTDRRKEEQKMVEAIQIKINEMQDIDKQMLKKSEETKEVIQ